MTQPTIEQIAAGLTEAQRKCLLQRSPEMLWEQSPEVRREMRDLGLGGPPVYMGCSEITPLGLAVRAHLQEQSNED